MRRGWGRGWIGKEWKSKNEFHTCFCWRVDSTFKATCCCDCMSKHSKISPKPPPPIRLTTRHRSLTTCPGDNNDWCGLFVVCSIVSIRWWVKVLWVLNDFPLLGVFVYINLYLYILMIYKLIRTLSEYVLVCRVCVCVCVFVSACPIWTMYLYRFQIDPVSCLLWVCLCTEWQFIPQVK